MFARPPEGHKPTKSGSIRDVARETGLSIATVSRVMNGKSNVSSKTRELVLDACVRLDYLPNPAARALSTNKSKTVAAIIPTIEHSVFAKFIASVEQTLDRRNYSLVLAISNSDPELELHEAKKLLGMGADAFILSGSQHHEELLRLFSRRDIPYVFTSVWEPENRNPTIGYDNFDLAKQAITHLTTQGHVDIAVIHGPLAESDRTQARKAGAQAAEFKSVNLTFYETVITVEGGKSSTKTILSSRTPCTAILCFSDVLAMGVYFQLQEASMNIPGDISVMGFDNIDWASQIVPPLTTINLPAGRMGREVAQQLVDHLEHGQAVATCKLPGEIVERHSIAKIHSRKAKQI